ncbi:hypothetical protein PS15p_208459 [Mucor circinelloides]
MIVVVEAFDLDFFEGSAGLGGVAARSAHLDTDDPLNIVEGTAGGEIAVEDEVKAEF